MSAYFEKKTVIDNFDLERRFGGLRRLYGTLGYACIRQARVGIVGLGGVGSWVAEALARSGVASITLFDLDHIAESNINRQVQALSSTLGQAKVLAIQERVMQIHPGCLVKPIEAFVDEACWPGLLPEPLDVLIDACDQVQAKAVLCAWGLRTETPLICVGAAGGKQFPHEVQVADLAETTHDPLLASLRQRLRQKHGAARAGKAIGIRCVFSREPVKTPAQQCEQPSDGTLNCHGYGSSVMVTSTFGMVAASEALQVIIQAQQ
ncbi:MAG: ThiF family adenylyltransferase [Burkholderiales bacterium]|jgi:tRNA A37 threonylcarbamoyladenosine dehydratase